MAYLKKKLPRETRELRMRLSMLQNFLDDMHEVHHQLAEEAETIVDNTQEAVLAYNRLLTEADILRDKLEVLRKKSGRFHDRIGAMVIGVYGRGSQEYQAIGGTRAKRKHYVAPPYRSTEELNPLESINGMMSRGE